MARLNRILVCIDFTDMDKYVIQYASMLVDVMGTSKVDFLHVSDSFGTDMEDALKKEVDAHFKAKAQVGIYIQSGNVVDTGIKWAGLHRSELIILGKKTKSKSPAKHATQITNRARCSVLLVPAMDNYNLKKLLVPVDFSIESRMSIKQALAIKEKVGSQIILQHVFYVHSGYSSSGKSYEEFGAILEKNARRDYEIFLKQNAFDGSEFDTIFTLDDDDKPFDNIYETAKESGADMIFLASRGMTKAASLIKRSTTIDLIKYDDDVPFFIVKDEKERMGFWEALMKI